MIILVGRLMIHTYTMLLSNPSKYAIVRLVYMS